MLGYGLMVVDGSDSLSKHISDREDFDFLALLTERDGVSDKDLLDSALLDIVIGRTREDSMRGESAYTKSAELHHLVGSSTKSASSVDHIIEKDNFLAFDITDDAHFADDIRARAMLVADDHRDVEVLGIAACTLGASSVRGGHDHVGQTEVLDVGDEDCGRVKMVDRDVEETLDLVGMKVHCDDAVGTSGGEEVGDKFSADCDTRLILTVLTCVAEIGHHAVDTCR